MDLQHIHARDRVRRNLTHVWKGGEMNEGGKAEEVTSNMIARI